MDARVPANPGSAWLMAGGWLSVAAALLHIACIVGGEEWYRFFGAGEDIAMAAARGEVWPHLVTLGVIAILLIWALFAFSGSGAFWRLPLLRTGLVAIALIYLARGLILMPLLVWKPEAVGHFAIWSSLTVLIYGIAYAVGTARAWKAMSTREQP